MAVNALGVGDAAAIVGVGCDALLLTLFARLKSRTAGTVAARSTTMTPPAMTAIQVADNPPPAATHE